MNLLTVRQEFETMSGRHDLVNSDGSDNGANSYIREGADYLDRNLVHSNSFATHLFPLPVGSFFCGIRRCMAISRVYYNTSDGRIELMHKPESWVRKRNAFFNAASSEFAPSTNFVAPTASRGAPSFWCLNTLRLSPDNLNALFTDAFTGNYGADGRMYGDTYDLKSVMLAPANETAGTLEVYGHFFQPLLEDDDNGIKDRNYWTIQHPKLLARAATFWMEADRRNSQGFADKMTGLSEAIRSIRQELAHQSSAVNTQMKG